MGSVMLLAPSNRRVFAGLFLAMPLVAIGPFVAVAQFGNVRTMPNGYPTTVPPNAYRDANAAPPKRDSLLGDQGMSWKLPFTRSKKPQKPQVAPRQSMVGRSVPRSVLQDPRAVASQQNRANMPKPASMAQRQYVPNQQQVRPVAKPTAQTATGPRRPVQRSTAPQPPRPMPRAIDAAPVSTAPPVSAAPKSPPASPAVRMLAQAHKLSLSATTETDYTRIIDTCHQASSGSPTPDIRRYANQLASWALNRRGQLKADAGNEEDAIADFDAAIQAEPQRWRPLHNRGVLLAGNGEFEKAFNDFSRTIELNPNFAKAHSNRAALFVVAGDSKSAI
jgi:hypothetical protein